MSKRMVGYLRLVNKATTHLDIHVHSQMTGGSDLLEKYQICIILYIKTFWKANDMTVISTFLMQ